MSVGMSAGGKHPKAIIAIDWETGTIRSGQVLLPKNFTQHILKFKDSATWPTGEIEYSYYLMAQKCGIQIERSSLLKAGGENHFLTERFDRRNGEKIHAATLRSLCGEVTVYDDIFRICRTLHTPYNDMEQMFRRTVFNYLTGVSDDHDKNFSFTMSKDGKWRLAPAYDLTFTVNYKNRFIGDRHAMSIKENDRNISGVMFLKLAEENDVRNGKDIINEIAEIVSGFESMAKDIVGDYHTSLISEYIKSQVKLL